MRGAAREPLVGIRGTSSSPLDVEPAEAARAPGLGVHLVLEATFKGIDGRPILPDQPRIPRPQRAWW
jgi:hypothetical protein